MKNKTRISNFGFLWFSKNFETNKYKRIFGTKTCFENLLKTLEKIGKIVVKNLGRNKPRELIFVGFPKYSHWGSKQVQNDLSVDRPVDRSQNQRVNSLVDWWEQAVWIGQPHGRPAQGQGSVHVSVHIGWPSGRPSSGPVDQSVNCQQAQDWDYRVWNVGF